MTPDEIWTLYDVHWRSERTFTEVLPIGLRKHHYIHILNSEHSRFSITPKIDGLRKVLCLLPGYGMFYIDRMNRVHQQAKHYQGVPTILDGEYTEQGYLAFDMLLCNGQDIRHEPFYVRHKHMTEYVTSTSTKDQIGGLVIVAKSIHPLSEIHTILPNIPCAHGLYTTHHQQLTLQADGIVLMDNSAPYTTKHIWKWKALPTVDVIVFGSDIHANTTTVQTWYWEYDTCTKRTKQTKFQVCRIENTEILPYIQNTKKSCVECYYDQSTTDWCILKVRPLKVRANSSRTIRDTVRIIQEHLTLEEMKQRLVTSSKQQHLGDHDDILHPLEWLGKAWETCRHNELEVRLLYDGVSQVPVQLFYHILSKFKKKKCFYSTCTTSIDYISDGELRTTRSISPHKAPFTIRKEVLIKYDISIKRSPYTLRYSLSTEHPCHNRHVNYRNLQSRQKRRHRFIYKDTVAFDFTEVQHSHCKQTTPTYEIEIEMLHTNIPTTTGPRAVRTLFEHMIKFVCKKRNVDVAVHTVA